MKNHYLSILIVNIIKQIFEKRSEVLKILKLSKKVYLEN